MADRHLHSTIPESGTPWEEILEAFAREIGPFPFGNGHPRFYGWVNSPPTVISIFAEALAAAMNPSCAGGNHSAIYVEREVINWFDICSNAWGSYVNGSLRNLITSGKGNPNKRATERTMTDIMRDELGAPEIVDRATFHAELDALRVREKAHTREGDAIAAARRRLPMVEVDPTITLIGPHGPVTLLDVFEGRRQLIAYYFMWHTGHPAPEQCEGCTWVTTQVAELSYIHSRDVTFAVFCQGPYEEGARYREFMGWQMPWYSALGSLETLLVGRRVGRMHIVCYLRQGSKVFETYWTTARGVEVMDNNYHLLDLTVYGRQETWEDSPAGWPQQCTYTRTSSGSPTWQPEWPGGRPIAQWPRLEAGRSDDLGNTHR